jgi:hypothetical protein
MLRFVIIISVFALTACRSGGVPKTLVHELTGDHTQRVAGISAILTQYKAPPTAILDAHFVEEQIGDGNLGPSDFRSFYYLEVAPQDIARWTQLLTPLTAMAEYASPTQPRDWWIARDRFTSLKFYKPNTLTGRGHGWIGISQQTGRIYIFTFTM